MIPTRPPSIPAPISTLALALALALAGCKDEAPEPKTRGPAEQASAAAPLPSSEAEFLAELLPVPGDAGAIEVRYAVTGPALEGELTILVREGGWRREQWELRTTGAPTPVRSAGLTLITPEHIWSAAEGQPGQLRSYQLGALARAWAGLAEDRREAVAEAVRDWHGLLGKRRAEVPGDQTTILDVPCLQTRIAAQNLCMWEEAGLFLRYEGSAFTIEAEAIDRNPTIPADAFALPPAAKAATPTPAASIDFDAALSAAAEGNFGELFLLTAQIQGLPSVQAPGPAAAEPGDPDHVH